MNQIDSKTQVVLLAGGLGSRIKEETVNKPKPMIEIGGKPILWHLMKYFATYGVRRFLICTGYKSESIVDYVINLNRFNFDFRIDTSSGVTTILSDGYDWEITVVHSGGPEVGTAGRILCCKKYIDYYPFICTYGDGLADVDLEKLISQHEKNATISTITVTNPINRFGIVNSERNIVTSFKEKPKMNDFVNSGFFVFEKGIWNYLDQNMLEDAPLSKLTENKQLGIYHHEGSWLPIDTFRDLSEADRLWNSGIAPWKKWQ